MSDKSENLTTFPSLFSLDKNGKKKEWKIQVENKGDHSLLTYTYGYIDGKKTEYNLVVKDGKNKGKKNETTHYTQACLDAESRWTKKKTIDKYADDVINENSFEPPSPMLAQDYNKHKNKVVFPCYIQPKLDGYRMVYYNDKMYSRNGKEYIILQNTKLAEELKHVPFVLDGELYVHNKLKFEDYGILRKQKLSPGDEEKLNNIEYHVYDIITNDDYETRMNKLNNFACQVGFRFIKFVKTDICNDVNDIERKNEEYLEDGYEGSIVRNEKGLYKTKYRSYDLLKYKKFDDDEFEIIDFTREADVLNKGDNVIVWICKTQDGKTFNVPSKGTREKRTELFNKGKEYIGKMLSVQYFGLTNDGIPRFPKSLRDGEASVRE
jgi:ATP-dependent DNA ligase